jgi:hypothetical protein
MALSTFTVLLDHPICLVPEYFIAQKKILCPLSFPSDILYKWSCWCKITPEITEQLLWVKYEQ